jgi:hypothetical protein
MTDFTRAVRFGLSDHLWASSSLKALMSSVKRLKGRHSLVALLTSAVAIFSLVGCGSGKGEASLSASRAQPPDPTDLHLPVDKVGELDLALSKAAPESFGGVSVDGASIVVFVIDPHRADLSSILRSRVSEVLIGGAKGGEPVVLLASQKTYSTFEALRHRVLADEAWMRDTKGRFRSTWIDYPRRQLVVAIEGPTARDKEAAYTAFGPDVRIEEGGGSITKA